MIESGATRSLSFVKTFFMKGYIEWQKNRTVQSER